MKEDIKKKQDNAWRSLSPEQREFYRKYEKMLPDFLEPGRNQTEWNIIKTYGIHNLTGKEEDIMKEEQDKRWKDLSEESKKMFIEEYRRMKKTYEEGNVKEEGLEITPEIRARFGIDYLRGLFGDHNLKSMPKTWEELKELYPPLAVELANMDHAQGKIFNKMSATLKIHKLIELGYGGVVSEEERFSEVPYFAIFPILGTRQLQISDNHSTNIYSKDFVAFHTRQQAEEFMSHKSNRELVFQYNMI